MPKKSIVIVLLMGIFLAACGKNQGGQTDITNGESPGTSSSTGDFSSEASGSSAEPGDVNAGMDNASLSLPTGFPEDFPLPEGASMVADFSMAPEENDYKVYFEVPGAFEETAAFFETAFPDTGWEIQGSKDYSSGETQSLEIQVAGYGFEGRVLILFSGEETGLEVSLEPSS